eukprot:gene9639-18672_t
MFTSRGEHKMNIGRKSKRGTYHTRSVYHNRELQRVTEVRMKWLKAPIYYLVGCGCWYYTSNGKRRSKNVIHCCGATRVLLQKYLSPWVWKCGTHKCE